MEYDLNGVCAAVVSYCPDVVAVSSLLERLTGQADHVLLVENASPEQAEIVKRALAMRAVTVLAQRTNLGIAGGINVAWRWASDYGCRFLVPFDQDSVPGEHMIGRLVGAYDSLSEQGIEVAAVGPQQVSLHDVRPVPFVRFGVPLNRRLWRGELSNDCVECDFLISSGCLLPVALLESVGAMEEGLFIDNVDLEWSFRARSLGFRLYGCFAARMGHRIGEAEHRFGGLRVRDHAPVRQYYMTRNRLELYRRSYTPWAWIMQDLPRLAVKMLYLAVISERRLQNRRMLAAAVRDFIQNRLGPFEIRE